MKCWGVKLTASHQLMPMLKIRGAVPPFSRMSLWYDGMVWHDNYPQEQLHLLIFRP
jgi:hypothetical protein